MSPHGGVRACWGIDTADEVTGFFRDHDGWSIGVAADDRRHDRRVNHPQSPDTAHPAVRVDYTVIGVAHSTGAHRVVAGFHTLPDELVDLRIRLYLRTRREFFAAEGRQGGLRQDLA